MKNHFGSTFLLAAVLAGAPAAQTTRYRDAVFPRAAVTRDLAYGSAVNRYTKQRETLRLDLYQPAGDTAPARPAVVIVHGGGFHTGDKGGRQFRLLGEDFARRGFVAISINYRLKPQRVPISRQHATDAAHDLKAAVRWLRKNRTSLRVNSDRIGCLGSSAGAITCCEAAYVPGEGNSGNPGYSSRVHAVVDLWGRLWDVNEMQRGEPPVQIIHGTKDPVVSYAYALALKARADQVGVPAELHPVQGAGHAPWSSYFARYHVPHVVAFLWEHLRLGQLSGLRARPGYRSPGSLTIDGFGVARDLSILMAGARRTAIPLGELGVWCLDPGSPVVALATRALPATPRLPTLSATLAVPAGLGGRTVYWQAAHLRPSHTPRTLTNCVATTF